MKYKIVALFLLISFIAYAGEGTRTTIGLNGTWQFDFGADICWRCNE